MATPQRRSRAPLIERVAAEPFSFEFFQAVRILENHAAKDPGTALAPVAAGASAGLELIRFRAENSLAFAAADIGRLERAPDDPQAPRQWSMHVLLMCLTGSTGVLPHHYTELLQQRSRLKDETLRHFFDLFNHRTVALFYKAWQKYRLPILYERHANRRQRGLDPASQAMACLIGMGTEQVAQRSAVPVELLIGYGGMLGRLVKSAAGLQSMLRQLLGMEVRIEQFRGQWCELPEDLQSRLPAGAGGGMNCHLGVNTILGSQCRQVQSRFRVRIGRLSYGELMSLEPGGPSMRLLKSLIRQVAGSDQDFDIALEIQRAEMPALQLGGADTRQALLGWNTCLQPQQQRCDGIIDVIVSPAVTAGDAHHPLH